MLVFLFYFFFYIYITSYDHTVNGVTANVTSIKWNGLYNSPTFYYYTNTYYMINKTGTYMYVTHQHTKQT